MRLKLDSEFPQYLTEIGPSFVKKSKKLSWDQLGLDTSGLLNIWKQDSLKITHLSINFRFKQNFSVWYWLLKTRMWLSSDSLESNKSWYLFNISFKFPPIYFHTKFCNGKIQIFCPWMKKMNGEIIGNQTEILQDPRNTSPVFYCDCAV